MRVSVALPTVLLVATVVALVPAQAQAPRGLDRLCLASDPCDPRSLGVDGPIGDERVDIGYAREDWSLRYATGRANLLTTVPVLTGLVLYQFISDPASGSSIDEPLGIASLSLAGAGVIVGPSMGEWCLGGDCARRSLLPLGVRVAGVGGLVVTARWLRRELSQVESFGAVALLLPGLLALTPSALVLGVGIGWSFSNTPRIRCGSTADAPTLSVRPAASAHGGSGLALRLRL